MSLRTLLLMSILPVIAVILAVLNATGAYGAGTVASPGEGVEAALDSEEQVFHTLVNNYRQANGLGTLSLNGELNAAADWMSNDMAAKDYFSHTDSLGRDPFQRMADFGYNYNTWRGENLAAGVNTAQGALDLWKNSPGHNANMLNSNFKVIGISRAYSKGTTYGWYWTADFGGQWFTPPPLEPVLSSPSPEQTEPTPTPCPECTPTPAPTPTADTSVTQAPAPVGFPGTGGAPACEEPDRIFSPLGLLAFLLLGVGLGGIAGATLVATRGRR